eukprot:1459943-Pleurochrysis_carterae.AAC.1
MHAHTRTCTHARLYVRGQAHTIARTRKHIDVRARALRHTHTHTRTHTRTHTLDVAQLCARAGAVSRWVENGITASVALIGGDMYMLRPFKADGEPVYHADPQLRSTLNEIFSLVTEAKKNGTPVPDLEVRATPRSGD